MEISEMSDKSEQGILAIWNDVRPGQEAAFDAWFQSEHLLERLGVPGFKFVSRHEALLGAPRYFNFYIVDNPDVLTSKPYLERLDNPTPMTKKIMSEAFINMNRTVCHRAPRRGHFSGAFAVTVRFNDAPDMAKVTALADELVQDTKIAGCELWTAVDTAGAPVSAEEKLRGGDKKIKACLVVDTLRKDEAETLAARLSKQFPDAEVGIYAVLCQRGGGLVSGLGA
jgi:hypothetical protein